MADTKMKILRVLDILKETDEHHPITANEICRKLETYGIEAERKSVSRDINVLMEYFNNDSDYGYEIVLCEDNRKGYYMCSRLFEDWELKILIDAVWQARFLTAKKSASLANRLRSLASTESRKVLQNVTPVKSYIKTTKPKISEHIDMLLLAIRKGRKVEFQYQYTDTNMEKQLRFEGKVYLFNPYALKWRGDRYYLIGNYDKYDNLSFYRLDRIYNLAITDSRVKPVREIVGDNSANKIEAYVSKCMYNFGGENIHPVLRVKAEMVDEIIDYFGEDIQFKKQEDNYFDVRVSVNDGDGLYFWLLQYAEKVKVISPKSVRNELLKRVQAIIKNYDENESIN